MEYGLLMSEASYIKTQLDKVEAGIINKDDFYDRVMRTLSFYACECLTNKEVAKEDFDFYFEMKDG